MARVPEPSWEICASRCGLTGSPSSPLSSATSLVSGSQPAASAASSRSSPSATNWRSLSRHLRPASLRTSLSCSLLGLVMVMCGLKRERAPLRWRGALERLSAVRGCLGRRGLAGALGESAEGLGVAHGDVGQHLAVQLDPGQLEAVDERAVAHALLAGSGVDALDPQAAEVALAV